MLLRFAHFFLVLALISQLGCCQEQYKLILHSQERGSACLDGTPTGLYIHNGTGENKDKFMIFFDSGGFCGAGTLPETLQSCYRRSSTSLGTTKNYKPFKSFDGQGVLSTKREDNPVFFDWTKIFVIYCDGSEHQGYRQNPISYKEVDLHFRGSRNSLEQFYYLDKAYDFYNKNTIVLTGTSAGGMATFQWSNYLMQNTKTAKVYAMPDSGFFITDYFSPIVNQKVLRIRAMNLLKLVSSQAEGIPEPVSKCLEKPGLDIVDCFNAANYAEFLTAPMFMIQSPYDQYSLNNILVVQCLKNSGPPYSLQNCNDTTRKAIEDYRLQSIDYIKILKNGRKNVGTWSPACVQHGYAPERSFNDQRYKVKGLLLSEAVQKFLDDPDNAPWLLDEEPWPFNKGCSGLANNLQSE